MSHVRPDRWADLAAGKLPTAQAERFEAHAARCERCAVARERILGARRALADVGAAPAPRAGWDLLGARLYWTVSSENRRRQREAAGRGRTWWRLALPPFAAAAGFGLCVLAAWGVLRREALVLSVPTLAPPPPVAIPFTLVDTPAALTGRVTLLEGDGTLGASVGAGARLTSGSGRLGVQLAGRSALVLDPGTAVSIVRLDEREIELALERGGVSLEVEPRLPGQTFRLRAAGRTVEVRGTAFRVAVDGERLEVGVVHGRVVVDGTTPVETAGRLDGRPLDPRSSADILGWTRLTVVPEGATAELRVETAGAQPIRIDGLPLTTSGGALRLRTNVGRHLVEVGDAKRWVTLGAGESAEVRGARGRSERPGQVDALLHAQRERLGECAARAQRRAPGLHGKVVVEIGIHVGGELDFVAPLSTPDADPEFQQCVIEVVRTHFSFPAGSRATVQKTIAF